MREFHLYYYRDTEHDYVISVTRDSINEKKFVFMKDLFPETAGRRAFVFPVHILKYYDAGLRTLLFFAALSTAVLIGLMAFGRVRITRNGESTVPAYLFPKHPAYFRALSHFHWLP